MWGASGAIPALFAFDTTGVYMETVKLDPTNIDAFSRIRTSDPGYRFDSQLTYGIDDTLWDVKETLGTATFDSTNRMAVLSVGGAESSVVMQSHYHAPYTPGRGQLALPTFNFAGTPPAGVTKEVGYHDGTRGVRLVQDSSGVSLHLDTATENGSVVVPQAEWSHDSMMGTGQTGTSSVVVDWTKTMILVVQMQALYVGQVTVGLDIDGEIIIVHTFKNAGISAKPYIDVASLPVRYAISNTSDAPVTASMHAICSSVISEGGDDLQDIPGTPGVASNKLAFRTVNSATRYPVLAIRVEELLNSIENNALVIPTGIDCSMTGTSGWFDFVLRPATILNGASQPTWTSSGTGSCVSFSVDATVITGGKVVGGIKVDAAASTRITDNKSVIGKAIMAYSHLLEKGDVLAICVTTGGNGTSSCTVEWKEVR